MRETNGDRTVEAMRTMNELVPLRLTFRQASYFDRRNTSPLAKDSKYLGDSLAGRAELWVVIEDAVTSCPHYWLYLVDVQLKDRDVGPWRWGA